MLFVKTGNYYEWHCGLCRYDLVDGRWIYKHDGHVFQERLAEELEDITGKENIDLDQAPEVAKGFVGYGADPTWWRSLQTSSGMQRFSRLSCSRAELMALLIRSASPIDGDPARKWCMNQSFDPWVLVYYMKTWFQRGPILFLRNKWQSKGSLLDTLKR